MSDELSQDTKGKGVSPARKAVSAIILIGLLVVLGIELRAGAGQIMTANAITEIAPDGVFKYKAVTQDEVQGMLKLGPTSEQVRDTASEVEVRYGWFSLLRPLFKRPEAAVYITYLKGDPVTAVRHGTEAPTTEELEGYKPPPGGGSDGMESMMLMPTEEDMAARGPAGGGDSGHDADGGGNDSGEGESGAPKRPPVDDDDTEAKSDADATPAADKPVAKTPTAETPAAEPPAATEAPSNE